MKVALFGGTGFVGTYITDELLNNGHNPLLLVRPGSENKVSRANDCTLNIGDISETGDTLVNVNPKFFRPAEVENLLGDSSYAKKILGWSPNIQFDNLVKIMVERDIERL